MGFCYLYARRIRCDRGGRVVRRVVCIGDHAIVIIGALGGCIGREARTVCAHLGPAGRTAVGAPVPLVEKGSAVRYACLNRQGARRIARGILSVFRLDRNDGRFCLLYTSRCV